MKKFFLINLALISIANFANANGVKFKVVNKTNMIMKISASKVGSSSKELYVSSNSSNSATFSQSPGVGKTQDETYSTAWYGDQNADGELDIIGVVSFDFIVTRNLVGDITKCKLKNFSSRGADFDGDGNDDFTFSHDTRYPYKNSHCATMKWTIKY